LGSCGKCLLVILSCTVCAVGHNPGGRNIPYQCGMVRGTHYIRRCSETMLTGESRFHISTPLGIEPRSQQTGSPLDQWDMVWMQWDCRLSTGLPPPSSRLCRLWSWKEDLQRAWNRDRRAVWDQVGLSHCRHGSLVMVQSKPASDEATIINHVGITNVARQC
jgi:hypothetical protein